LTAERNAGELEGDLWEDIELEMHIEEVMDTMPQISDAFLLDAFLLLRYICM
jgi:hypothetical protein